MILKIIKVNTKIDIVTNTYLIVDEEQNEGAVIDPGGEISKIMEMITSLNVKIKYIIITHCHYDHIGALYDLKQHTGAKILMSRMGAESINDSNMNLSKYFDVHIPSIEVDSRLDDGDLIHIGNLEFKVILTPGHTKDGVSIYSEKEKLVFSGDTMFAGGWGRIDLPTGSLVEIMDSITNKLLCLPDETIIYPGHDRPTTIRDEKVIYNELKQTDI